MLTIGEFSILCRVSAKTLRYYDQIGLLKPGHVCAESGYRYYEASQLRDMLLISRLKQYQFSLPEISAVLARRDAGFLSGQIRAKREQLRQQMEHQETVLHQMERDIESIERCENIMENHYGIKTVDFRPRYIYSLRKIMGIKDFGDAFGELMANMGRDRVAPSGVCLALYHDEDSFNPEESDIEIGAEVSLPSGRNIRLLDPGFCCFASHIGPYEDFSGCYAVLSEWIEKEGYTVSGPPVELYVKGCESNLPPSQYVTEIYFPIRR